MNKFICKKVDESDYEWPRVTTSNYKIVEVTKSDCK